MIDLLGSTVPESWLALVALDVAFKATVLTIFAFACHGALGRRRALARSALWNACLIGLLLLPAASLVFPRVHILVGPARATSQPEPPAPSREAPPALVAAADDVIRVAQSTMDGAAIDRFETAAVAQPVVARPDSGPENQPASRLGGTELAVAVYLAIAALLSLRLAASLMVVARLRRQCRVIDDERWAAALEHWRSRLSINQRVPLLASDAVSVPVTVGGLRPAIIVPTALAAAASPALIDAVLLHELAHVRRGDFGWNLVRKLVHVVYWPHPLVWLIGRVVGAVREQACDDLCVHGLGGAGTYRDSLLEVARALVRRPDPALGMAMARATNLGRRLAWIDRSRGVSRCLSHWPTRLALVLAIPAAAAVLGSVELARATAQAPAKAAANPTAEQPAWIDIFVRAKDTGKPLEGAIIRPSIDLARAVAIDLVHTERKTDRDGRARIGLFRRTSEGSFNIDVWADGYVQQRHFFSQNDARYPKIPDHFTVELLPGEETLGGRVTDEHDKPISGVTVKIWGYLGEKKQKDELAYMVESTTDDQGRWRCRCFRNMTFAYLYLSHPDYLSDGELHMRRHGSPRPSQPPDADEKSMKALRDFSDVQIMTRGVVVAGEVRDEQGRPIAGALVGWLEADQHQTFYDDMPTTMTDAEGGFRFPHVRPGRLVIQVKATGHAPELAPVDAKVGAGPVAVTLRHAGTLAGRVIDSQGKPIPDAFIAIDTWRSYRALGVFFKTDSDGRFRWEDAPADSVLINASRSGFQAEYNRRCAPGEEAVFTLKRSLSISGQIRDAKTKKAIDDASVEFGAVDPKAGTIIWGKDIQVFAHQGRLQANVDVERTPEFRLRFRAKGYEPHESRTFRAGEPQIEYDVSLTPTDKPQGVVVAGVVVQSGGKPLAGAEVAITYPMTGGRDRLPVVHIENGKVQAREFLTTTKTDAAGRFSTTREPDPLGQYFAVVVVHPDFYAEVNGPAFMANSTVVARPWGRVEGVARVGAMLAAGASIRYYADRLGNRDVPYVYDSGETKADAQGRFVVERVVPGDVRLSQGSGDNANSKGWSNGALVDVRPGETTRAELGGTGRPVVARIALPPGFDPKGDYTANSQFQIESDRPRMPYPKAMLAKRDSSLIDWSKAWWASAEGHEYRRKYFQLAQVKLQADGTIRADDIPPGEYKLTFTFSADQFRGIYSSPERFAYATKQFTIPEIKGGRSDLPYDLGMLRPSPRTTLKVGQPAPAFDIETLDGRRVKLGDFRGKYLLIDFWATWCGPCVAEMPELKAVFDRVGKDGRFAMLSVSLDAEKDAPRKFAAEKGLTWTQGFIGDWVEGGMQDAYHVRAIPAIFLIGPDGKLKAQGLRADSIAGAVSQALERR